MADAGERYGSKTPVTDRLAARMRGARDRLAVVLAMLSCWGIQTGSPVLAAVSEQLATWAAGPVQWLLLPEEKKDLKRIRSDADAQRFIETFWQRRDEDPQRNGNAYRDKFFDRVEAADTLYGDEGDRGSLTDRGRALILLGPPAHVTVSTEPVMAWDPASQQQDRVTMRDVAIEIWGYRMEDLPTGMVEQLMNRKKAAGESLSLTMMFRTVGYRTNLVEGEELLEAAARAAVARPDGE